MERRVEYYGNDNLAKKYNFELFEQTPKRKENAERRKRRIEEERKKKELQAQRTAAQSQTQTNTAVGILSKQEALFAMVFALILLAAITLLVRNHQKISDITAATTKKSQQLMELTQDYELMRIKFDSKMSDSMIEEYAVKKLGMQHRENNQTEWLDMNHNDLFEDCSRTREFSSSLHSSLAHIFS